MNTEDTICAIATAQGGAIGIIRVSGPEAITITDRIFTPVSGQSIIRTLTIHTYIRPHTFF